jgi:hypothetical protein
MRRSDDDTLLARPEGSNDDDVMYDLSRYCEHDALVPEYFSLVRSIPISPTYFNSSRSTPFSEKPVGPPPAINRDLDDTTDILSDFHS